MLKAASRLLYEPGYLVPAYLRNQRITSIVTPMPTTNGALWTRFGAWTVILYPWINGESSLTGITRTQWTKVGSSFRRIHEVKLPSVGFEALREERFDPTTYVQWIRTFETQHLQELGSVSASQRALRSSLEGGTSPRFTRAIATLEKLAEVLQARSCLSAR